MLPQIAKLTRLDVYRDGGSISASFHGTDGDDYTLFFQRDRPATAETTTSFSFPKLHRYTPTEYKSPITGVATPDWKRQESVLSWADARALLDLMALDVESLATDYPEVYPAMRSAAMVDGKARRIDGDDALPPLKRTRGR
jgi:hypothetical protein